jgi:prefoldin beta subunit
MTTAVTTSSPDNPGNVIASAVDAEVAKFRELQEELEKLHTDVQLLGGQEAENEMVLQELDLISDDSSVYKMVGPVLIKQETEDSRQTVRKRLEFIRGEKEKLQSKVTAKEKRGQELSAKVQQMQAQLQQTTAQAVRAIQDQHKAGGGSNY